jgi:16S rRNA (guanine966-N2)-methyltransferase
MRVIAGKLGGLPLQSPKQYKTHPMSDKMRNGLFNVLGDIKGLSVLDVFAGSGALAIEAISRGAKNAVTVESDKTANKAITENVHDVGLEEEIKIAKSYFISWSSRNQNQKFDIILADPPYHDLHMKNFVKLVKHLKDTGTLVLSWPKSEEQLELQGLKIIKNKDYGDGHLVFYRKVS